MSTSINRELELKFLVPPTFEVPSLVGVGGRAASRSDAVEHTLVAVYYDTADLRLARHGVTLRRRTGGSDDGWHLKLPRGGTDGRSEISTTTDPIDPPAELTDLVTSFRRGGSLVAVATLVTQRRSYTLLDVDGRPLADVVDDWVTVESGDRVTAPFREVEVEDRGGGEDVLAAVSEWIISAGARPGEFLPKAVRALGPRALAPPDPGPVRPVTKRIPVGAVVESLLRAGVADLTAHDPPVRLGQDGATAVLLADTIHLRTGLRLLRPLIDRAWADEVRAELAWLIAALTPTAAEVALPRLLDELALLSPELRLDPARLLLSRQASAAAGHRRERARSALQDPRWPVLLDRLVLAGAAPPLTRAAGRRSRDALPGLVTRYAEELLTRAERLGRPSASAEDYRRARAGARRLHLAVALSSPVLGKAGRRTLRAVVELEKALDLRAAALAAGAVARDLAAGPRVGSAGFALGVLYDRQRLVAEIAARESRRAWSAVRAELVDLGSPRP